MKFFCKYLLEMFLGLLPMIFFCNNTLNLKPPIRKKSKGLCAFFGLFVLIVVCMSGLKAVAQEYVFDPQRFQAVEENGAVRSGAEAMHDQYLGNSKTKINDINTNASVIVLAQEIIYEGLSQVNSALKDGIAAKNIVVISADILNYLQQAAALARSDPALLLVTTSLQKECKTRALMLVTDVSNFVLKSGNNVLADYNARDELLKKVVIQLQIIDGLAYGAWRAMYWAKERGVIASLNPFQSYIDHDITYVNQIIFNAKHLHQ